jgi:osmoprotectant transport system substrate-binding protein
MKKHLRLLLALLAAFTLLAAACSDDDDSSDSGSSTEDSTSDDSAPAAGGDVGDVPTITIGVQDFGESAIVSEIYSQVLTENGYDVELQELGGFRDLEEAAFEGGDINFAASEYVASMLLYLDPDTEPDTASDVGAATEALAESLSAGDFGGTEITAFQYSEAVDTNSFVVTSDSDLTSLADLTDETVLGAPQDCEENPFCLPGLERVYGVDLSGGFVPLDGGPLVAAALDAGEIEVGVIFSTSGLLAGGDYTTLEDPDGLAAADNLIPVATAELAEAGGTDLAELIDEISAAITTEDLVAMNERFDIEAEDADVIATDFIAEAGL